MSEIELPNVEEIEELKEKAFTRRVALVTAVFAVALAVTSLGGNNATKEMMLAAQQATNQWAFYQAKTIRENLSRNIKAQLQVVLNAGIDTIKPEARKQIESELRRLDDEVDRYGLEKTEIEKQAKQFEAERDTNRAKDPYFDYAEVLLQIAIVMASIAILSASRLIFFFALGFAVVGSLFSMNGFFLILQIPFLH